MDLWKLNRHRRNPEAEKTSSAPGNLDLDLVDVMLDLDPDMLAWSPRRDGSVRKGAPEHLVSAAARRTH